MSISHLKLINDSNDEQESFFTKYARQSSIHGFKYLLVDNEEYSYKAFMKRIFWILILFISFICFIKLSIIIGQMWNMEPAIIGVHRGSEPIWNVPFPAVTICPEMKAKRSVFNFTSVYHQILAQKNATTLDENTLRILGSLLQICFHHLSESWPLPTISPDIYNDLRQVAPTRGEMFSQCSWRGERKICVDDFSEVWTSEGLCFTFNSLNSSDIFTKKFSQRYPTINHTLSEHDWSVEAGYKRIKDYHYNMYPYRVATSGTAGGVIAVMLQDAIDFDYICRGPTDGYKVMVHRPDELPDPTINFYRLGQEMELLLTIKPVVYKMSDNLKYLSPEIRNCYFQSESKLQYFNHYSLHNCKMECLANYINIKCSCALFTFPLNDGIRLCGPEDIDCVKNAKLGFHNESVIEGILQAPNINLNCKCLPSCNSIEYEAESAQTALEIGNVYKGLNLNLNNKTKISRFGVVFKDQIFVPVEHILEQRRNTEIIALIGGLFALFFGASILSIIEFFYLLFMHFIYNKKSYYVERNINYKNRSSILEDDLVDA